MTEWTNDEKTLIIIGVLIIAAVFAGFAFQFIVSPMITRVNDDMKHAAAEAKAKDDRQILSPTPSDQQKIVGKWGDAISIGWTGKNTFIYEFKTDGTYTYKDLNSGTTTTGKWGRLKGNNQLVTRRDSDTYSSGSNLRVDSSGQVFCDSFRLTKIS